MARVKLSEFRAKNLLLDCLGVDYTGVPIDLDSKNYRKELRKLPDGNLYVVKVDQAVKKRGKSGLVFLSIGKDKVQEPLDKIAAKGYRHALIEPFVPHEQSEEHYVALLRTDNGIEVSYSAKGGIDVESNPQSIMRIVFSSDGYDAKLNSTGLDNEFLRNIYELFQRMHMTLLEINPLLIKNGHYLPLDAAVEVDSAGEFFASNAWTEADIREANTKMSEQEKAVEELKSVSPASFSLKVLNPNGSMFLLLSGGGASVVVADELANQGDYKTIANYGEYSGNPTEDETYIYTKELIELLLNSASRKKVLLIAGGVANFTDVAKTFAGIIRAMDERSDQIKNQKIKIFVRRGGPNQEQGLKIMESFLNSRGINNEVHGPEYSLAAAATAAAKAAR